MSKKQMAGPREEPAKATFTFERIKDGRVNIELKNTGFNHFELVGLLQLAILSKQNSSAQLAEDIRGSKL